MVPAALGEGYLVPPKQRRQDHRHESRCKQDEDQQKWPRWVNESQHEHSATVQVDFASDPAFL